MNIKEMPKIDLHCHLDGSLTLNMVRKYAGKDITLKQLQVEENCKTLAEYLEKFDIPIACIQTEEGLQEAAYTFIEDVAKENTKYIEVRFAPMLSVHEQLTCNKVIEAVLQGLKVGEEKYGVHANIITCAMRHHSLEENRKMMKIAREYLGQGVCALDLAGDEARFPTVEFKELFQEAKQMEMPFVIHSGECGSVENVRMALELGASRIGHGIALIKDTQLMREYAKAGIGIEMCPTSNLETKAVKDWGAYPFMRYMEAGLKVSINTDNRMVSGTSMTKELQLIYDSYGKDMQIIRQVLRNAVETSFANNSVKGMLLAELL